MFSRNVFLPKLHYTQLRRRLSTATQSLDEWIASTSNLKLVLLDSLRADHLSDLYITIPTRDGTRRAQDPPLTGAPLGYGHHLAFFHPRNPESLLRPDGTDKDFCPPEPFTRRMWAGGEFEWKKPLLIGENATATSTIASVEKKGFEKGSPLVFVNQKINFSAEGSAEASLVEYRTHVYLPTAGKKTVRERRSRTRAN
jgi:hydroxyacyl-ACP dehydratase HTD2-like protein with hotdog domain